MPSSPASIAGPHLRPGEPARLADLLLVDRDPLAGRGHRLESEHQAARHRPRLAAQVADLPDDDRGLLEDLAGDRVLGRLPRLDEPGERPTSGPSATARSWPAGSRSSGSVTSMITAGSSRGKCSVPSTGQVVRWPAGAGTVAVPHRGQCVCVSCQYASATAWVSRPASRSLSSAPTCRSDIGLASASDWSPSHAGHRSRYAEVGDAVVVDAEQEPGACRAPRRAARTPAQAGRPSVRTSAWESLHHEHPACAGPPRRPRSTRRRCAGAGSRGPPWTGTAPAAPAGRCQTASRALPQRSSAATLPPRAPPTGRRPTPRRAAAGKGPRTHWVRVSGPRQGPPPRRRAARPGCRRGRPRAAAALLGEQHLACRTPAAMARRAAATAGESIADLQGRTPCRAGDSRHDPVRYDCLATYSPRDCDDRRRAPGRRPAGTRPWRAPPSG